MSGRREVSRGCRADTEAACVCITPLSLPHCIYLSLPPIVYINVCMNGSWSYLHGVGFPPEDLGGHVAGGTAHTSQYTVIHAR
jgi:hypothetical protein